MPKIRAEAPDDFIEIGNLLDAAFQGSTYESALVQSLRPTAAYMPELTVVAEEEGKIVAFAMLSRVSIETRLAKSDGIALGPVAVLPGLQRRGLGCAVVKEALRRLDASAQYDTTAVLGDPKYYSRFGFRSASGLDIYPAVPWEDEHFMARVREWGAVTKGMVRYPEVWNISADFKTVQLRRAERTDMQSVARTFAISFRHAMPFLPNLHTAQEDREFFTNKVFGENDVWLAADGAGQVLGFIGFTRDFVHHLYVLPIAQGRGIGRQLIDLAKKNAESLKLWTFQRNEPAREFYKQMGFVEIRLTDGEGNEENEPDVLLEWKKT
jgi:putative acetyltransferase